MPAKILVVDDESSVPRLLTQMFRKQIRERRYEFSFAQNASEALEQIKVNCPDLILADIQMPKINGFTFLSQLKQQNIKVKTIIISAYGTAQNFRQSLQERVFDFITKPIDYKELEKSIERTLQSQEQSLVNLRVNPSAKSSLEDETKVRSTTVLRWAKELNSTQQFKIVCQLLERFDPYQIEDIQYELQSLSVIAQEEEEQKRLRELEDKEREANGQIPLSLLEDGYIEARYQDYTNSRGETKQYKYLFVRWRDPISKKLRGRSLREKDLQDPKVLEIVNRKLASRTQEEDYQLEPAQKNLKASENNQRKTIRLYGQSFEQSPLKSQLV